MFHGKAVQSEVLMLRTAQLGTSEPVGQVSAVEIAGDMSGARNALSLD